MENNLSYNSLKPHLTHLHFGGCYKLSSDAPKLHRFVHTIYMCLVLILALIFIMQEILKVYEVRHDADRVMDTMFLLLTNSDYVYKQIILWIKSDQIEELLDIMKGPIFNQGVPEHQGFLLETVRQAQLLLRVFNMAALSTCVLFAISLVILHMQGKPYDFAFWLPFDANTRSQFYFIIIYMWIQTSWIAFNNTTIDTFIYFSLAQCTTQLSILRLDLENVVKQSKEEAIVSENSFEDILQRRFHNILKHYNEIILFFEKVQAIFNAPLFYQFLVTGWILCTTAYRIANMSPASVDFISMLMYLSCMLTQLFSYCFFGTKVYVESERLMESAYAMDWLDTPLKHHRELIAFMERIKRPIKPRAGNIIELSNSTFVSILRSSYSFYAFLKTTD